MERSHGARGQSPNIFEGTELPKYLQYYGSAEWCKQNFLSKVHKKAVLSQGNRRDTASVRYGLNFADVYHKIKSSHVLKVRLQSYRHTDAKQILA